MYGGGIVIAETSPDVDDCAREEGAAEFHFLAPVEWLEGDGIAACCGRTHLRLDAEASRLRGQRFFSAIAGI